MTDYQEHQTLAALCAREAEFYSNMLKETTKMALPEELSHLKPMRSIDFDMIRSDDTFIPKDITYLLK